ncbi:hypothetical protein ACFLY9_01855 [Patescibacteria group bacterium]
METAPKNNITSWRKNSWNLRMAVAENSKGCIMAPINVARFLAERMKHTITDRVLDQRKVKIIEPIILTIAVIINLIRSL